MFNTAKLLYLSITCLLLCSCAAYDTQTRTGIRFSPDKIPMPKTGTIKKGDVFITAIRKASGGAVLKTNTKYSTALGSAQIKAGEPLFYSRTEKGYPVYCTVRKAVNATLSYQERFSACLHDKDNDGDFDRASMLDFRSRLSFGSGALRHESEITPVQYKTLKPSEVPYERIGVKYFGATFRTDKLLEGKQFNFRMMVERNGEWKGVGKPISYHIPKGGSQTLNFLGGLYELSRGEEGHVHFKQVAPIRNETIQNRTTRLIGSRY